MKDNRLLLLKSKQAVDPDYADCEEVFVFFSKLIRETWSAQAM